MPVILQDPRAMGAPLGPQRLPQSTAEPEEVSFFQDVLPAAFRRESPVGSFLAREKGLPEWGVQDTDFDPFEDVSGYEQWSTSFAHADSPEELAAVKRKIDREREDERTILAGGVPGIAAAMASGLIDPLILFPVGGTALATRGLDVLRRGLLTAQAGFVGAGASEAALHSLQETRTWGESATNVAAATVLSGILGTAVGALPSEIRARALNDIEADLGDGPLVSGATGDPEAALAIAVDAPAAQNWNRIKGALGAERATAWLKLSPVTEAMVRSESQTMREVIPELVELPLRTEREGQGIAAPISVENEKLGWRAQEAAGLRRIDELWVQHRLGRVGGTVDRWKLRLSDVRRRNGDLEMLRALSRGETPKLTREQFRQQVSRAMRRGDEHALSEVAEAARFYRETIFDPLKEVMIRQGRLPEGVNPRGAVSYLMRDYNPRKIARRENEFRSILRQDFQRREPELSFDDADLIAQQVIDRLLGLEDARLLHEPIRTGGTNATKERSLLVEDRLIEEFLEDDIAVLANKYIRTTVGDSLLIDKFGDTAMTKQIEAVQRDYQLKIREAKTESAKEKLGKRRDRDVLLLRTMRDRIRGIAQSPAHDPNGPLVRIGRTARNLNVATIGGGFMLSALPDLGRFVMVHGLSRTMRHAFLPLVSDLKGLKMAKVNLQRVGEALDLTLDSRAELIHDIGDDYGRHTKFERVVGYAARSFGVVSGLAPWNQAMKTLAGSLIQTRIGDAARKVVRGTALSRKESEALAHLGLDESMLRRIGSQTWEKRRSLRLADTTAWTDVEAIRAYGAALRKSVNETIVTPGAGDLPRLITSEEGRLIGQFKSFAFASVNRTFLPALQQRDMAALNGIALSVGMGTMVAAIKLKIAGRDSELQSWTLRRALVEGVDRSGVLGFYADMTNMLDTATRGTIGPRALVGGPRLSRYAVQGRVGALLGPTVSQLERMVQVSGAGISGDWRQGDVRALRRLAPYQNLFYVSQLFDAAENGAIDAFNVPRTSQ